MIIFLFSYSASIDLSVRVKKFVMFLHTCSSAKYVDFGVQDRGLDVHEANVVLVFVAVRRLDPVSRVLR